MTKHTNSTLTPALSRTPLSTEITRAYSLRPRLSLVAGCALLLGQMAIATDVNAINVSELDGSNGFTVTGFSNIISSRSSPTVVGDLNGDDIADILVDLNFVPQTSIIVFGRQGNGFPDEVDVSQLDGSDGFKVEGDYRGSGDFNHDGNMDLLFQSESDSSSAFVVYGQEANGQFPAVIDQSQMNGSNGFTITEPAHDGTLRFASQGDVSGDGIDDILVEERHNERFSYYYYNRYYDHSFYVIFGQDNAPLHNDSAEYLLSQTDGNNGVRIDNMPSLTLSDKKIDINGDDINDVFFIHITDEGHYFARHAWFLILKPLSENGSFPGVIDNLPNPSSYKNFVRTLGIPWNPRNPHFNPVGDINGDSAEDLYIDFDREYIDGYNDDVRGIIALGDQMALAGDDHSGDINFSSSFNENFFGQVFALGDVNSDGIDDMLIENRNDQDIDALILFGRDAVNQGSFPDTIDHNYFDGTNGVILRAGIETFLKTVTSGDFNADGINDIVTINVDWSTKKAQAVILNGRNTAFPARISFDTLEPADGFIIDGLTAQYSTDFTLSSGDVNGDGADDIIIGAKRSSTNSSSVYVVFGELSQPKPNIVPILDLLLNDEPGGSQP